jgi:hypothetical protein
MRKPKLKKKKTLNWICTNLRKSVYQPNQPNNGPTLNLFSALPYVSTYVPSTSLIDRRSHFDRRCCTGTALHRQRRRRRRQVAADESDRSAGRPVPATLQSPSYYLRPAMCRPILLPSAYQTHSLGVGFMCGVVGLDVWSSRPRLRGRLQPPNSAPAVQCHVTCIHPRIPISKQ